MMQDRIRTLLLYASQFTKVKSRHNRLSRRDLMRVSLQRVEKQFNRIRRSLLDGVRTGPATYDKLSYITDWKDAICAAPELDVTTCDVSNLWRFWALRRELRDYSLVIVLHSVTGDDMSLLRSTEGWFQDRRGKLVVFVGNEYDLLEDKIGFLRETSADYVCSQLPIQPASWLYEECTHTEVLETPHALNPAVYTPGPGQPHRWDVGFRGDTYGRTIGDRERDVIIEFFRENGPRYGLSTDIKLNQRMNRAQWSKYLGSCRAIIGAESGSYYIDRRALMIEAAKHFVRAHPEASFDEVFDHCFRFPRTEYIGAKCISSRHFEPIGTKTCQILVEGDYNGILKADEHYIAVKRDLANIDDAICRFKDPGYRQRMVDNTLEYALDQHTYKHRVNSLIQRIAA